MKHFNWDCECEDCMIMKAGRDLYEACKQAKYLLNDIKFNLMEELTHTEKISLNAKIISQEILGKALAKVNP